jgi:hypothetical protein
MLHPVWQKAMQNSSIGEARSRAFLLDHFCVLEKSVDIEVIDKLQIVAGMSMVSLGVPLNPAP